MCGIKVFCVIPCLGYPKETLESVFNQTVKVTVIKIAGEDFSNQYEFVGERVGHAVRKALLTEDLTRFSHILRVDGDTLLPKNFLEKCLRLNCDLCNGGGYAQLFTVKMFLELFNGVYPATYSEDTYFKLAVINSGYSYNDYPVQPIKPSTTKTYSLRSWIQNGIERYKLGLTLKNAIFSFMNFRSTTIVGYRCVFIIVGWLYSFFSRQKKYFFAK